MKKYPAVRIQLVRYAVLVLACTASIRAADTLDMYFIDVEGGQSTLIVSPSGETMLIDTGFAGDRDASRVAAAAKIAKINRIDYFLATHLHGDHIGGVTDLVGRIPVGTFLDHGPSVERQDADAIKLYNAAIAKSKYRVIKAGDKLPVKGLDITAVSAGGKVIERPGEDNPFCQGIDHHAAPFNELAEGGEDAQSVGIVLQFGKFRFVDLGDIRWNGLVDLLCPQNKVGKADLYWATRHGNHGPEALWAIAPRVTIIANGPRKGASPDGWKLNSASPGIEDIWQMHFAVPGLKTPPYGHISVKEDNTRQDLIANLDEGATDQGMYLKVSASQDGTFTMTNSRNQFTKTYRPK